MEKPITLVKSEFVEELTDLINTSGLPLIILEPIFTEMAGKIQQSYMKQCEAEKAAYERSLHEKGGENDD